MKIAILVHNAVLRDARVIKEAKTLKQGGYEVEIHGITPATESEQHFIPDTNIPIFLNPKKKREQKKKYVRKARKKLPARSYVKTLLNFIDHLLTLGLISGTAVILTFVYFALTEFLKKAGPAHTTFIGLFIFHFSVLLFAYLFSASKIRAWIHQGRKSISQLRKGVKSLGTQTVSSINWLIDILIKNIRKIKYLTYLYVEFIRENALRLIRHRNFISKAAKRCLLKIFDYKIYVKSLHKTNFLDTADALVDSVAARPNPDIIHIHDHVALLAAKQLKTRYKAKIIWDAHEIYEDLANSDPSRAKLNASIIARNEGLVDGFVTINDSIAEFYKTKYSALKSPVVLMNATQIEAVPEYDGRLHDAAKLPRSQKILLFQGGFAPKRGLAQLVECSQHLEPDWSLVMMGWGNLEGELRKLVEGDKRNGRPSSTVFLPGVPHQELQKWSAGAALGAIPYENTSLNHLYCTPNKLWEYPSAGVPILCTDLVEMATIVKTSGIGFMLPREFTSKDISTVVNSISAEQLAAARRNCAKFITENNWQTYAPRLLELYGALGTHAPQGSRQADKLSKIDRKKYNLMLS